MSALLHALPGALANGCIYGLVSLSFVLIYKSTRAISFMQGEILMLGAFLTLALQHAAGWPLWLAICASIAALSGCASLTERFLLRPIERDLHLNTLLLTFGCASLLQGLIIAIPAASQRVHILRLSFAQTHVKIGPLLFSGGQLLIIATTIFLAFTLALFFRYSRAGQALRACAEDTGMTALLGIDPRRLHRLAWQLGAAISALAGIVLAPVTLVHAEMGNIALKAFPAAVLGGMHSLPGALLAGILIGVIEILTSLWLSPETKDMASPALLLLALLLWPRGLGQRRHSAP